MGKAKKASKVHWKKINHLDVDEYLDDERVKERYNFFNVGDDFFSLDKGSGAPVQKETEEPESDALVDFSKLRCFQLQKPHTNVPDPLIKRNTIRINSRVKVRKTRSDPKEEYSNLYDPWSTPQVKNKIDDEWFREEVVRQNNAVNKTRRAQKTTEIKAIEVPHPGFSINPSFGHHQDLLRAALDIEKQEIKREEKLNRATRVPATAVKEEDLKQENIVSDEIQIKSEPEDGSDDEKNSSLPKMKTKKQRRKEKLSKESQQTASELKKIKVRESDVYTIKRITRDIEATEKKQKAKLLHKVNKKIEAKKFGQKALSKWKFQQPKLNPLLSDELSGRLIETKNNSSLLSDRFKSFQQRNILEVRVKQRTKRLNKLKRYQRPSEKMEWEKTGVWNGIKLS